MSSNRVYTLREFADAIGVHYFTALGMVKRGEVRSVRKEGERMHKIPACEVRRVKRQRDVGTIKQFRQRLADFVLAPSDVFSSEIEIVAEELSEFIVARMGYNAAALIDVDVRLGLLRGAISREIKRIRDARDEIKALES